jgi:hypothetical protein
LSLMGSEARTGTFIRQISARVAGAVPYRLLDEASWATQGCAPLFRSAITFAARRALAAGIRRSTCTPAVCPRRPASPSAPTGSAPTRRAASSAQSTRLLLSNDLVAYCGSEVVAIARVISLGLVHVEVHSLITRARARLVDRAFSSRAGGLTHQERCESARAQQRHACSRDSGRGPLLRRRHDQGRRPSMCGVRHHHRHQGIHAAAFGRV